jgi:hypothetical protein
MTIKVRRALTVEECRTILYYFNTHFHKTDEALEILKKRPGFMIRKCTELTEDDRFIRQIRWQGNLLVNYFNYKGFSVEEEELLYKSIHYTIGSKYVSYYPSLSHAIEHSPSTIQSFMLSV